MHNPQVDFGWLTSVGETDPFRWVLPIVSLDLFPFILAPCEFDKGNVHMCTLPKAQDWKVTE